MSRLILLSAMLAVGYLQLHASAGAAEASDQETSARPPAGWERIVGTYRTVGMAPDQLSLVEKFSQVRIEEVGGRLSMAIAKGRRFTLEPGGAALTFALHGGQGDGEMLRFRSRR